MVYILCYVHDRVFMTLGIRDDSQQIKEREKMK